MRHLNPRRVVHLEWLAMLAVLFGFPACGGVTGEPDFVGSWMDSGQMFETCNGITAAPSAFTSTLTISKGVTTPLTVVLTNPACALNLDVDGNTATLIAGQTCSVTTMGITATLAYTSGSMMLSNSTNATISLTGTLTGASATGSVQCMVSETATATQVAP